MKFGPYETVRELGRGGFGRVYLVERDGRQFALKVLDALPDPEHVARFRREAEALTRAGGDTIVSVHDVGTSERRLYFVMDLMPGGSLRETLRARGRLPWRDAAAHAARIARALEKCHALGLVHRDVKPENVLLDAKGAARLADFGAVRDVAAATLTETGSTIGTLSYMAPEVLDGGRAEAPADVFALGVVLHELVTGERPWREGSPLVRLRAIVSERRRPIEPRALEALVARAVAKERGARPSAGDLAGALEALVANGEPTRSSNVLTAGVLFVALVGAVAVGSRRGGTSKPVDVAPVVTARTETTAPVASRLVPRRLLGRHEWRHSSHTWAVAVSPRGDLVASGEERGILRFWDATTGAERGAVVLPGTPRLTSLSFTRDGASVLACGASDAETAAMIVDARTLAIASIVPGSFRSGAFVADGSEVVLVDAAGDVRVHRRDGAVLRTVPVRNARAVAASPDGRSVLIAHGASIVALDHETGATIATLDAHEGAVTAVSFVPGLRAISSSEDRTIRLWDLTTGDTHRTLRGHGEAVTGVAVTPDGERAVSVGRDFVPRVWDLRTAKELRRFEKATSFNRPDILLGVAMHPAGGVAYVTGLGHDVRRIPLSGREGVDDALTSAVSSLAISPDGTRVAAAYRGRELAVHDLETGSLLGRMRIGTDAWGIAFDGTGERVVVAEASTLNVEDGAISILRAVPFERLTATRLKARVTAVAFTADGRGILAGRWDGKTEHRDAESLDVLATFVGHSRGQRRIALSGDSLLTIDDVGGVRELSVAAPRVLRDLGTRVKSEAEGAALSADGRRAVIVNTAHEAFVLDMPGTWRQLAGRDWTGALDVSADGSRCVIQRASSLELWDLEKLERLDAFDLSVRGETAWSVAFSPRGDRVAAGTDRGVIHVFEVKR